MSNIIDSGSVIKLGQYPYYENGEKEPMQWAVLHVSPEKGVLVVNLRCIDSKQFNEEFVPMNWEGSSLRRWLNNEFFNSSFSDSEKRQITYACIDNNNLHPDQYEYTFANESVGYTNDYIFLLSISEYNFYLKSENFKMRATQYAIKNGAYCKNGTNCGWWLRTPAFDNPYEINYGDENWWGRNSYIKKDHITFVYCGEYSREDGNYTDCTGYGVCPAMWLSREGLEKYATGQRVSIGLTEEDRQRIYNMFEN